MNKETNICENAHYVPDVSSTGRYTSLDLLRVVCMFMIVLGHGIGPQEFIVPGEIRVTRLILAIIGTFSGVAVNCFILISGFFLINQEFRLSRLIRLAVEVLFYSWLILLVNIVFHGKSLGIKELLALVFPISFEHFWFISAYFGLSLISPVLNMALNSINRKQHFSAIVVFIICFSLWSDLLPKSNPFGAGSGYCLTWFVVLYAIAAYIRKYADMNQIKKKVFKNFCLYALMMITVFLLNSIMTVISFKFPVLITYDMNTFFSRYNCCLVLVASLAFFSAFLGMKIERMGKVLRGLSKLTLGVYLIHGGPFTSQYIWSFLSDKFNVQFDSFYPLRIIYICTVLFGVCLAIDFVRSLIFRLWENSTWFTNLMRKIDQAVYKVGNYIYKY